MKHIFILGPTASGKTTTAIKIATHFKTSIISADSRQIYKELNIGTAKPTSKELLESKHYFINSHELNQNYSAGQFSEQALKLISDSKKPLVICGGTNFYIHALLYGLDSIPEIPSQIRNNLNQKLISNGISTLQNELKLKDPISHETIDINNPHRLIRALEVYEFTGKTISSYQLSSAKKERLKSLMIGLKIDRDMLYDRINKRLDKMFLDGLVEEARSLIPYINNQALQTVGYKELFEHFSGSYDLEEAKRLIKRNTRRFAKRQLTWLKRYDQIKWFEYDNTNKMIGYIEKNLRTS